MTSLLILDDQPYTARPFVQAAQKRKLHVEQRQTISEFVETAERWAGQTVPFAALVDLNIREISEQDIDDLGATREEMGNGAEAGLVVVRHVFANGHTEPLRTTLARVPVAIISAERLENHTREGLLALKECREGQTAFIPKAQNAAAIPSGLTYAAFLNDVEAVLSGASGADMAPEMAIFLDVKELMGLSEEEGARLLGFLTKDIDLTELIKSGTQPPSRDWRDRLDHLMDMFVMLMRIYPSASALKWINAPQKHLDGRSPRDLLVSGDMASLLYVEKMVMEIGNQAS